MSVLFPNGYKGLADSKSSGPVGSVARSVGIDAHSEPGVIKVHQALAKHSGSTIDELCKVGIPCSDGSKLWFSSESGKIWREVSGTYTLIYTLALSAFNLLTATPANKSADVNDANNQPKFIISNDGLRLSVLELFEDKVHDFILGTAWDLSTIGSIQGQKDFSAQVTTAQTYTIKSDDGTKMYVCSSTAVFQYTLSTPWSVATASYDTKTKSVSAQTSNVRSIQFKPDGTKMYILSDTSDGVLYQYTLSTPWDVSTATYDSVSYSFTNGTSSASDFSFNPTGTKLYLCSLGGGRVLQYSLSVAYDLSTITYDNVALYRNNFTNDEDSDLIGTIMTLYLRPTGENVYFGMVNTGIINQFNLGTGSEEVKTLSAIEFTHKAFVSPSSGWSIVNKSQQIIWTTEKYIYRLPVDNLASPGDLVQPVGSFAKGDNTYHPLVGQNLSVYIGDKTVVAEIDNDQNFIDETELVIPTSERIISMIDFDVDILIGTKGINFGRALRWDGVNDSWSAQDTVYDTGGITAFLRDDNYVYALSGEYGRMYYYDGEKLVPYKRIIGDWSPTKKMIVYPNAVGFLLGIPVFGLSNLIGDPTLQGVYSFGSFSKDYPKILDLAFPISSGEFTGMTIGAIIVDGADLYVSWKGASTQGVDKLDYSAKYASAYFETMRLTAPEDRSKLKTITEFVADYTSHPVNTNVTFKIKKANETNFPSALTPVDDTNLQQLKATQATQNVASAQLRVDFVVSGNTAPEIENFAMFYGNEKR